MIGRVLLAALLAGIAAGILMGAVQHLRLTPLILEAERYESHSPTDAHHHAAADEVEATQAEWLPADGVERTLYTTLAAMVTGAAYAALLAGVSLLSGLPLTARNGLLWGIAGFIAAGLAPAAGLSPELPGMPAGDLAARQVWWVATVAATGAGIYLLARYREGWAIGLALLVILLPHAWGAPQPVSHQTSVPAGLAAAFAANAIAAQAIFWCAIGTFLGFAIDRRSAQAFA